MTIAIADAKPRVRAEFIRKTYTHLAGAILAFACLEVVLLNSPVADWMLALISTSRYTWLLILGAFAISGWFARSLASNLDSVAAQYVGLGLYVLVEAIIFIPLLYIAIFFSSPDVLPTAALLTGLLFAGLTAVVFTTKKDFIFLQSALTIGGFIALGLILGSVFFGFNLGLFFSVAMIALAGMSILYDTSKVMHHYHEGQHVAAALELFASVALMFWYVLRLLMELRR